MKPIVPLPPPLPVHYNPLPDHTQLPDREGGAPLQPAAGPPPDHTLLPDKDGTFVKNSYESWQSHLLTNSLFATAKRLYPGGDFFIGEDCGVYWRLTEPPEKGCKAPDWFFVPEVPQLLDGQMRRSYVLWQEIVPPLILLEYVSGDGREERDQTPFAGKYWVYEQALRSSYYAIYEPNAGVLEVYVLRAGRFVRQEANAQGRYPIAVLDVELGPWPGTFGGYTLSWLRWWDTQGMLLPTGDERADKLAEKLRALGVNPDEV